MSTDTPRTDAMCNDYSGPLSFVGNQQFLPADFARQLERENAALKALWTEARVIVAQGRDANCLISYGKQQCDAVAAANAWLNKMPSDKCTIDDASATEWQLQRVLAERDSLRAQLAAALRDRGTDIRKESNACARAIVGHIESKTGKELSFEDCMKITKCVAAAIDAAMGKEAGHE